MKEIMVVVSLLVSSGFAGRVMNHFIMQTRSDVATVMQHMGR